MGELAAFLDIYGLAGIPARRFARGLALGRRNGCNCIRFMRKVTDDGRI